MSNFFESTLLPSLEKGAAPVLGPVLSSLLTELDTVGQVVGTDATKALHDEVQKGIDWLNTHL